MYPCTLRLQLVLSFLLVAGGCANSPALRQARLSDREFEQVSLDLSEPAGDFDTDNLISNEACYQHVIPQLKQLTTQGQVYLGVGPDQNFTYIAQLRPRLAFIIDIRRENLLQHLYFKDLFRQAKSRLQFLSLLSGRPLHGIQIEPSDGIEEVVTRFRQIKPDLEFFESTFEATWESIRQRFPKLVEATDRPTLDRLARPFFEEGLDLRFRSHGRPPRSFYPTYAELLEETDLEGKHWNYLASDIDYEILRSMQTNNQIVPVVGDLSGDKAVRSIGRYLAEQGQTVSAFYVSNVEFYLFQSRRYQAFISNLEALPHSADTFLIRSYFSYWQSHPQTEPGYYVTSLIQNLEKFLALNEDRPYRDYWDAVSRDYVEVRKESGRFLPR